MKRKSSPKSGASTSVQASAFKVKAHSLEACTDDFYTALEETLRVLTAVGKTPFFCFLLFMNKYLQEKLQREKGITAAFAMYK